MPFTSVKRPNSCLPAVSALRRCQTRLEPEGIIEHRHFRRAHQNSLHANAILDLSCPAGMPKTQLSSFAELMLRIEDAAKNQTARNPEFPVLDSVGTSGRRVGDEDRDGESW